MAYDAWQGAAPPEFVPAVPKPDDKSGQQRRSAYYENPKRLYWGQLTDADAALYTAPAAPTQGPPPKVEITRIVVCNTDTGNVSLTLQIRTGASAAATHLFSARVFAANTTEIFDFRETFLEASEIISGLASVTAKLNVRISGIEYLALPTG